MNLLAVYGGCLLTAALVSITGWVADQTCCRPELRGSGPRWHLLPRRCLRLLSAGATLHAAIVLGGAAGRYGPSRALAAPVQHAAFWPLVWLTIFRISATGAARRTRVFLAPPAGGRDAGMRRRRADGHSEDLAVTLAAAGLPGRNPEAGRDRTRREAALRATRRREARAVQGPPRRGENRPYGGRAVRPDPGPPVWRATTAHLAGLYPWLMGTLPPAVGVYVGYEESGSQFSCHPIEWLLRGIVTNPNVLICGLPGSGKSSHVKIPFGWRLVPFGARLFIPGDIKGEYPGLCRALGVEPIALGPGLPGRVNPLDAGPLGEHLPAAAAERADRLAEISRRRLALLVNMAEIRLRRRVDPFEEQVLAHALHSVTPETARASAAPATPTIPQILAVLRDPDPGAVREHRLRGVAELRRLSRDVTSALASMVAGVLGGLFDANTTISPDWAAPIVCLDVSRLDSRGDDVVAAALSCLSTWGQAAIDTADRPVTVVVRDELWRWMTLPGMARKIDSDLRLSRAQGTVQVLATHRLSDFEAVGDAGSEEVAIARGVVASCQTRILLAQDLGPLHAIREEIGLTDTEVARVASWGAGEIGRALWKVGAYGSHDVQLVLSPAEREITMTNERMRV